MKNSRWMPPQETTRREELLLKRLTRTKKLFAFLRQHRSELFDDAFQEDLSGMYRQTDQGKAPVPPALLAMAVLLQAYTGASDAEAVELTVVDARWQLVLDHLGKESPAFSQGALQAFRKRMIEHDMDKRLLERTAMLARQHGGFDSKKLPKNLRLAVDSRPLEGAGRVEDTFNLIAHAARILLREAARLTARTTEDIAEEIGLKCLTASSVKRGLDIDWSDPEAKQLALERVLLEAAGVQVWVQAKLGDAASNPPLSGQIATLQRLRDQDLEPDPEGTRGARIKRGVARDRQVSVTDPEMRHGRKTKSKRFNGYKSHIALDLDVRVIWACAVTPANLPEATALATLKSDLGELEVSEWHVDRGYISASEIHAAHGAGMGVFCRPWRSKFPGRFGKEDFRFNFRKKTVTCPQTVTIPIHLGTRARFPADICSACPLRNDCTGSNGGRTLNILADEPLQHQLRREIAKPEGRDKLRQRVAIEHRLAHHAQKQGRKARYLGTRNNLFDSRRYAAVLNLEVADSTDRALAA